MLLLLILCIIYCICDVGLHVFMSAVEWFEIRVISFSSKISLLHGRYTRPPKHGQYLFCNYYRMFVHLFVKFTTVGA